jgi:ribosome-associated protein
METIEFKLSGEFVELCDLLKLTGLADSGGRGKAMVGEGLVKVDGVVESRKTAKIRAGRTIACGDTNIVVVAETA